MLERITFNARVATLASALAALPSWSAAQSTAPPQNVVTLTATAALDVYKDWLTVVFSTTREGVDARAVQAQLRQALDSALQEARKVAQPGQLEVQTGAFALVPKYAPPSPRQGGAALPGGIVGWQGSAELIVQGRDAQAIAQLSGRVQTLAIARVGYSLSREARQQVEGEVTARAIERFRADAAAVSRQFGFGGYTVREVNVGTQTPFEGPPVVRQMAMRADSGAEPALPTEAGKATVSASVTGSVQMK